MSLPRSRGSYGIIPKLLTMVLSFHLLIVLATCCFSAEPLPPLRIAESMVEDGPEVLAAMSAMARDEQLAELERQRMGGRYFFNANFGYSDEPLFETSDESASYSKIGVGAGITFPLFGTWSRQKISALESEIRSIESQYRPLILKLHNLAALRKAYATLWSECEKTAAAKRFLQTEENASQILREREKMGLLLPADRLEFMSAYEITKRDVALSEMRKTQALQIIRLATGRLWEMPESMEIPDLPAFGNLNADIERHPEISMKRNTLKKYQDLMKEKRNTDSDGSFTIGATAARDFPGSVGSGVYASFTVSEPFGTAFSKDDKAEKAARNDLSRAEREELFMRIKIQGEADEAASLAAYSVANIRAQESRLAALTEAVRARIMRHSSISGDTFEQLQKSRYQYYRGVIDIIDSEMMFMQTGADLLSYAYPEGLSTEPKERINPIADTPFRSRVLDPGWLLSRSEIPGGSGIVSVPGKQTQTTISTDPAAVLHVTEKSVPVNQKQKEQQKELPNPQEGPHSVYVWDAAAFLAPETRLSALRELHSRGFDHLLISFTAHQLANFENYYGRMELEDLLSSAERMGIRADLLLGEPTWLYPEERQDLIKIIKKMKRFKFKGIHLDIEPDSLPNADSRRKELISCLTQTIRDVKKASDLKLSISIHPRYLEGGPASIEPGESLKLELEYISVMIYTTNADSAARRIKNIMLLYPSLNFKLAQSVERVLPSSESYFTLERKLYRKNMDKITRELSMVRGFSGLIIQAWEDMKEMKE